MARLVPSVYTWSLGWSEALVGTEKFPAPSMKNGLNPFKRRRKDSAVDLLMLVREGKRVLHYFILIFVDYVGLPNLHRHSTQETE